MELDFDVPVCDGAWHILLGLGSVSIIESAFPSGHATHEGFACAIRCHCTSGNK